MARHGVYARVEPHGMRVARYYCREGHTTFSLLPDFLSSRLPSTLEKVEQVVVAAEAARNLEQAAVELRPEIETQGALRWLRRRLGPIRIALLALATLLFEKIGGVETPTLARVRTRLGEKESALVRLRELACERLQSLAPPLGFGRRTVRRGSRSRGLQHKAGPDPPGGRG